jgi:hypothetical protein
MERARERCLVIKSGLNRDIDQRHTGLGSSVVWRGQCDAESATVEWMCQKGFE